MVICKSSMMFIYCTGWIPCFNLLNNWRINGYKKSCESVMKLGNKSCVNTNIQVCVKECIIKQNNETLCTPWNNIKKYARNW